jgi:hypothetical protein
MSESIMRASRPGNRRRKPKTYEAGRVCAGERCSTVVSRYNRSEFCFEHRPVSFPRLRGILTEAS